MGTIGTLPRIYNRVAVMSNYWITNYEHRMTFRWYHRWCNGPVYFLVLSLPRLPPGFVFRTHHPPFLLVTRRPRLECRRQDHLRKSRPELLPLISHRHLSQKYSRRQCSQIQLHTFEWNKRRKDRGRAVYDHFHKFHCPTPWLSFGCRPPAPTLQSHRALFSKSSLSSLIYILWCRKIVETLPYLWILSLAHRPWSLCCLWSQGINHHSPNTQDAQQRCWKLWRETTLALGAWTFALQSTTNKGVMLRSWVLRCNPELI